MECHLVVNRDKIVFILHTYDVSYVWEVGLVRGGTSCSEQNLDGTWKRGGIFPIFSHELEMGRSNNGWFGFQITNIKEE